MDAEGLTECKIVVSNSLDEYIIRDILLQGAKVDAFGVGERLITSKTDPIFGGVYKLCAVEEPTAQSFPKSRFPKIQPKITTPHRKRSIGFLKRKAERPLRICCVFTMKPLMKASL